MLYVTHYLAPHLQDLMTVVENPNSALKIIPSYMQ